MISILIHGAAKPLKRYLPGWIAEPIRSAGIAVLGPLLFSWRSGHFRSSFRRAAVSRSGDPLPWYTYPCIDFLKYRSFKGRTVLEFGSGQSTLWWAERAERVVAMEGDVLWYDKVRASVPTNTEVNLVTMDDASACVDAVDRILASRAAEEFDVVIIDGLWRNELVEVAVRVVADDGIIICDDAEGYSFFEAFKDRDFERVDFFGFAPGSVLPHCTSIFSRPRAFVFDSRHPIPRVAAEL